MASKCMWVTVIAPVTTLIHLMTLQSEGEAGMHVRDPETLHARPGGWQQERCAMRYTSYAL